MDSAFKKSFGGSDENALAIHYNNIERWENAPGDVALPQYPRNVPQRVPWTEEEHREFLYGLLRFKGDWRSISKYSVPSKSISQVASHAQKYFKRLAAGEGKRQSIHDIRSLEPGTFVALHNATNSRMPKDSPPSIDNPLSKGFPKEALTNIGNQMLPPTPFPRMPVHPFYGRTGAGVSTSSVVVPTSSNMFASQPAQEPRCSIEMPVYPPPFGLVQDCGVRPSSSFGVPSPSHSEFIDPNEFLNFPHFLD